ncbi:glycosyltransferase [Pigmentibacter sp. JX0631]|uniref:glycosyltransferase n=1 Tax=Pigmentibacter sp. JX0631 TaxID=2976982 RepID=UPI002469368D|nr:glycosyltransferase [Pigmentibacter sp. JX0631]WGL60857.1 glycosyltransferase [Pigmentibacter sp. JX0631]
MKLAFYIPSLRTGGAEYVAIELLTYLSQQKQWEVFLLTDVKSSTLLSKIPDTVSIVDLNYSSSKNFLNKIKNLFKAIKLNKLDLIVSNISNSNIHILLLKVFYFLPKIKVICVEHSIPSKFLKRSRFLKDKILSKLLSVLYNKSDAVVCVSNACKLDLVNNYKVKIQKCFLVYNPINIEKIKILSQENIEYNLKKICKNRKVISTVSRLSYEKNVDFLIDAIKHLSENYPDLNFVFLIVGDGLDRARLEKKVSANKLDYFVVFIGNTENPFKYVSFSDLFIFAGRLESFGNIFVEALALNKKIMTLESPGALEILENGKYGEIMDENVLRFSQKMYDLLNQKEDLNDLLLKRALDFDSQKCFDSYKELLEKLS